MSLRRYGQFEDTEKDTVADTILELEFDSTAHRSQAQAST